MQYFLINDGFEALESLPHALPDQGFIWISGGRREFEVSLPTLQHWCQRNCGGPILDLHISDLLNSQLPSQFDYTSVYDLMVFRRLSINPGSEKLFVDDETGTMASAQAALAAIDTSPVGFVIFNRVLITIHPADCSIRDFFVSRMEQLNANADSRGASRLPTSPDDLMLRFVNYMVDGYLDLRRLLTKQLGYLQRELLRPNSHNTNWQALLDSRNALYALEDVCEDQQSATQEWIDALAEWPATVDEQELRERELLRVRARDVAEHIERVLAHVQRLQQSVDSSVQIHFSAVGQRTNNIMRLLTVLTAIFLPLNLITGFFGMNFDSLPLIHNGDGIWVALVLMLIIAFGSLIFFWRKRYLSTR